MSHDSYYQAARAAGHQFECMAKKKSRSNSGSTSMPAARRRSTLRDLQAATSDGDVIVPKVINAAPSLEKAEMYGIDDVRPTSSRMMALAGRIFIETIPQWLAVGGMLALIFGGCCSNVSNLDLRTSGSWMGLMIK